MSATYSISVGTIIESLRKDSINSVLQDLPDNSQKLISPKDVRDAFLSAWSNSAFKQTIGTASIEYIGIDSGDPSNRDIKEKIFIGKRSFAGHDIMNSSLLTNANNDIYFFNTKLDSITQSTRISILAGTDSVLHLSAPYIESSISNNVASLDFINPSLFSGPINIYSNTGRVSINGILFPTVTESASASNGKILKYSGTYPGGYLKWADPTVTIAQIGSTGSITNIYGSPSNVNGYSLEFVDTNIVPQTIGGVEIGSSFSSGSYAGQDWPLSEVIRKILYPYVPPTLTISVTNSVTNNIYAEAGITSSGAFSYYVSRYSYDINNYEITGTTYSGLSFSGNPGDEYTSSFTSSLYNSGTGSVNYVLKSSDSGLIFASHSATASINFVYPFYYSFSTDINLFSYPSVNTNVANLISVSNKFIYPYLGSSQSVSVNVSGTGYIYFITDYSYPKLSTIKDVNGYDVTDSFTYSGSVTPYSPATTPAYRVYKTILPCSYIGSGKFEFIF